MKNGKAIYQMSKTFYEVLITGKKNITPGFSRQSRNTNMFKRSNPLKTKKAVILYINEAFGLRDEVVDLILT